MLRVALIGFVGVVVVGLCGCGVSADQSKKLWSSIESSLGHGGGSTKQQALSVGLDFNVDCADGGTASLTARLDVTGSNSDGTGINTGTIPSKTLRESALALSGFRQRGFREGGRPFGRPRGTRPRHALAALRDGR